jgi:hypothetical protein
MAYPFKQAKGIPFPFGGEQDFCLKIILSYAFECLLRIVMLAERKVLKKSAAMIKVYPLSG